MEHFTGTRGEIDAFGNGENTQAHRINQAMNTTPQSLKQMSIKSNINNLDRIRSHMRFLVDSGFAEQHDSGWALTESAALKFSSFTTARSD